MQIISELVESITLPLGIALILMYSFDRFNTPPSNRALTTAARYYTATAVYMLIYLLAYCILLYYPDLINWLLKLVNDKITIPNSAPTAVVGAILLSIAIPKLPILRKFDSKLKKYLQNLAAIPIQALKLSRNLQEAKFSVSEKLKKEIKNYLLEQSFDEKDLIFQQTDTSDTAQFLWVKNTAFLLQLKNWEKDDRFMVFLNERKGQFKRLEERYMRLQAMALNCFSLSRLIAGDEKEDSLIKSVNRLNVNFKDQAKDLFEEMCHFISQGVLKCQLTHGSRCRELRQMGFQQPGFDQDSIFISIHQMITLACILIVFALLNFILIAPKTWDKREETLLMITMIVSIYSLSVFCAIFLKEKYAFFKRNEDNYPPVAGYLISGLAAVIIAIPVNLIFKTLIFARQHNGLLQPFMYAWKSFAGETYPWMFMAFITASITSLLCDYSPIKKIPEIWWQFIQATIQAVVTALASLLVHWWLRELYLPENLPSKALVLEFSFVVGFVLGFAIPHWYRLAKNRGVKLYGTDLEVREEELVSSEI